MQDRITRLGDEQAIRDVLACYWRGIDRRDRALVAKSYHDDAFDDHGYYKGPVAGFVASLDASVWAHFDRTQHFSGHIAIEFEAPDRARVESYAEAHHVRDAGTEPATDRVYGLRYVDRFECRGGLWKIAHRVCAWDWARLDVLGDFVLPPGSRRGELLASDPVCLHPAPSGARVGSDALIAKQACQRTLMRYARGVDRCDPELVRSAYHEDAVHDHGAYRGPVDGMLEHLVSGVMKNYSCTMHKLGNQLIEVDLAAGVAYAETYADTLHIHAEGKGAESEPSELAIGVRYVDRLEDRGAGWKIARREMCFDWERARTIGSQAAFPGFEVGRRDGQDPVLRGRPLEAPQPKGRRSELDVMADRAEIYSALVQYCRGVDRRDLDRVRAVYHPDAYDDHGSYRGDVDGFLEFVARDVHGRFRTTQHKLGQAFIEVDGDVAESETYAICHHVYAEEGRDVSDMVMGIRYLDRFERRAGRWRIASRRLLWEWLRTDSLIPLDESWTLGRTDERDPIWL